MSDDEPLSEASLANERAKIWQGRAVDAEREVARLRAAASPKIIDSDGMPCTLVAGLSKIEYFAGLAMQMPELVPKSLTLGEAAEIHGIESKRYMNMKDEDFKLRAKLKAHFAVLQADALLAELAKRGEGNV